MRKGRGILILVMAMSVLFFAMPVRENKNGSSKKDINKASFGQEENDCVAKVKDQWYLDNDGDFLYCLSDNSWQFDNRKAIQDVDINYFQGKQIYNEKRKTTIAVVD